MNLKTDHPAISLRVETSEDERFLSGLYVSVRWDEFEAAGWTDEVTRSFLLTQYRIQRRQYEANQPGMERWIVESASGIPVGRLYLRRSEGEVRVVDISLLKEWRGRGIGGSLLSSVLRQADALGLTVRLSAFQSNPALSLYQRLGFKVIDRQGAYWHLEHAAAAQIDQERQLATCSG